MGIEYHSRFDEIFHYIISIAKGNFSLSLEPTDKQDELDTLIMLLNDMGDEIKTLVHNINKANSSSFVMQFFFMTDPDLKVLEYSKNIPDILTLSKRKLNNITFTKLLSKDSKNDFEQLIHIIESPGKPDYQERKLVLEFKNSQALLIKSECFIHPMKSGSEPRLFITCSKILYRNQFLEKISNVPRKNGRTHLYYPSEVEVKMLESKRELIQKIYIWIKKNLDKPLPDLGEKATEWGASKSTIRKEFKKRYGSGIHTFHRNQRLETAALMILETEQSIKRISLNYGFKSLPHFTNVFKKKFGCSPSQYRKLNPRKDLREQSIHTTNKIFNDPGEPLHIHGKADE